MKLGKLLLFTALAVPTISGCSMEPTYNIETMLNVDSSQIYFYGTQEITFSISDNYVQEYGLKFASSIDSSCISEMDALKGKTYTFSRISDTSLKVTFSGNSSHRYEKTNEIKFDFKFNDNVFSKSGFHHHANEFRLTRNNASVTSFSRLEGKQDEQQVVKYRIGLTLNGAKLVDGAAGIYKDCVFTGEYIDKEASSTSKGDTINFVVSYLTANDTSNYNVKIKEIVFDISKSLTIKFADSSLGAVFYFD